MAAREFSRRDLVRMSLASAFGVASCPWLPRLAAAAEKKPSKACIVLWMSGGPSQTDTWDLKPDHKNGGPSKEMATAVPGLRISEHLTKLAAAAKDLGIIRSMTTKEGEHLRATQLLHTGQLPSEAVAYPALGSMLAKEIGDPEHDLPSYITISPGGLTGGIGAGFLGPQYAPMSVSGISDNPNARANLSIDYLKPDKQVAANDQEMRRQLLADLQGDFEKQHGSAATKAHAASYRKAQKMIDTEARGGFRLDEEPAKIRDAYGRSRFGQGCLLARRLVEPRRVVCRSHLGRLGYPPEPRRATQDAERHARPRVRHAALGPERAWHAGQHTGCLDGRVRPDAGHQPQLRARSLPAGVVYGVGRCRCEGRPGDWKHRERRRGGHGKAGRSGRLPGHGVYSGRRRAHGRKPFLGRPANPTRQGRHCRGGVAQMSSPLRTLLGLTAIAAGAVAWLATGGGAADNPPMADDPDVVRDVFLLLDRRPVHLRLKITIGGKSPQAVRRDYLARLFQRARYGWRWQTEPRGV